MNLRSGFPYWLIKDGIPYEYPMLSRSMKAHVLIMGGGISGALLAYHLTEAGIGCILVDAQLIGLGSTCASTGLLQYEIDVPLFKLSKMIGKEKASRCYSISREAVSKTLSLCEKLDFRAVAARPSLYYSSKAKDTSFISSEFKARREAGIGVQFLDAAQIEKNFGFRAACGIFSQEAAEVDAYGLTHAVLQHSMQKGLKVFARTRVHSVDFDKTGVTLTTGQGYTLKGKLLLNATGYEASKYLKKDMVKLYSTYACNSEQTGPDHPLWKSRALIWNTDDPYLYLRTTHNNRIMIGGRDEPFYDPDKRDALIAKKVKLLKKDFEKLFPDTPFVPEYSWAGTFVTTPDGLPYIGHYKWPNNLFALGFGGNGITFSLVAAEILRDKILGKTNMDESLFAFDR